MFDSNFLKDLQSQRQRVIYAKIQALDLKENFIEEITGRITGGSISVDGTSAIRRTCSLSMVAKDLPLHEYYWGFKTKFRLFIGLQNNIDDKYPEIIWIPQGVYLITSFNTSQGTNNYNISISGKDKMALLNGDMGGVITAKTFNFGTEIYYDENNNRFEDKRLLKDIIIDVVHTFAQEPFYNIVVNDLDQSGYELLEYRSQTPMYLLINTQNDTDIYFDLSGTQKVYLLEDGREVSLNNEEEIVYDVRSKLDMTEKIYSPTLIKRAPEAEDIYTVIKVTYGEAIGYRLTDLVYAGDLIGNVGESVTTACLDKIKNMLGEYEYFYNIDGQFVFQRKRNYLKNSWNNITQQEDDYVPASISADDYEPNKYYINQNSNFTLCKDRTFNPKFIYYNRQYNESFVNPVADSAAYVFSLEGGNLITAYQNNPDFANVKNDYSVWGSRTSTSGASIPIHLRYAIDKKPTYYKTYDGVVYSEENTPEWREILYQMAADYLKNNYKDDFQIKLIQNNIVDNVSYYPTGVTGYEQYYTDMNSFWRELYNPDVSGINFLDSQPKKENIYFEWDEEKDKFVIAPFESIVDRVQIDKNKKYFIKSNLYRNPILLTHYDESKDYYDRVEILSGKLFSQGEEYFTDETGEIRTLINSSNSSNLHNQVIEDKKIIDIFKSYQDSVNWMQNNDRTNSLYKYYEQSKKKAEDELYKIIKETYPDITGYLLIDRFQLDENEQFLKIYFYIQTISAKTNKEINIYKKNTSPKQVTTLTLDGKTNYYFNLGGEQKRLFEGDIPTKAFQIFTVTDFYPAEFIPTDNMQLDNLVYYNSADCAASDIAFDLSEKKEYYWFNKLTNNMVKIEMKQVFSASFPINIFVKDQDKYLPVGEIEEQIYYNKTDIHEREELNEVTAMKVGNKYRIGDDVYDLSASVNYYIDSDYEKIATLPADLGELEKDVDFFTLGEDYISYVKKEIVDTDLAYFKDGNAYKHKYIFKDFNSKYTYLTANQTVLTEAKDTSLDFYDYYLDNYIPVTAFYSGIKYFVEVPKEEEKMNPYTWKKDIKNLYLSQDFNISNHWNFKVKDAPETLNFWIDFIDCEGELSKYSIPAIGNRPKTENDDNIKAIYFRETPYIVFVDNDIDSELLSAQKQESPGYTFLRLNETISNLFTISAQGKSAMDKLDTLLYTHSYCAEAITVTSLPIYHLSPNTRIFVNDTNSNISGEYLVSRITIPLTYNGTMSISATKAVSSLY